MLQQTRVAVAVPYFERFIGRFPTVQELANAPAEEVLRLWAGLGYYRRARNLQRAAQEIVAQHGGEFPRQHASALSLPGVGPYTAAAVLSIAYSQPMAVLDGNVARVLARLDAMRGDLRTPGHWRALQQRADALVADQTPGAWNQAMMELGATVCTPRLPSCEQCPLAKWCMARKLNITDKVPLKRTKPAPLKIKIAAAVLLDLRGRTLLVKSGLATNGLVRAGSKIAGMNKGTPDREISALFSNMWRFPSVPVRRNGRAELARHLREVFELDVNAAQFERLPDSRHAVTFRQITLTSFLLRIGDLPSLSDSMRPHLTQLSGFPISNATRKIARSAQRLIACGTSCKASGKEEWEGEIEDKYLTSKRPESHERGREGHVRFAHNSKIVPLRSEWLSRRKVR